MKENPARFHRYRFSDKVPLTSDVAGVSFLTRENEGKLFFSQRVDIYTGSYYMFVRVAPSSGEGSVSS